MDSDETVKGGVMPEEKPDVTAPVEKAAPEEKPPVADKPPAAVKRPGNHNWMMIALIVVSCVAVFLLVVTLALGAILAFHPERGDRFEGFGRGRMGPMMRGYGEGGWRQGPPRLQQSAPPAQSAP